MCMAIFVIDINYNFIALASMLFTQKFYIENMYVLASYPMIHIKKQHYLIDSFEYVLSEKEMHLYKRNKQQTNKIKMPPYFTCRRFQEKH